MLYFQHFGKTIRMLYFQRFQTVGEKNYWDVIFSTLWNSLEKLLGCYIFNTLKQSGKTIEMLYFQHFETSWKTRETCSIVKTLKQSGRTRVPCSYIFILYFSTLCNSLKKLERRLLFSTLWNRLKVTERRTLFVFNILKQTGGNREVFYFQPFETDWRKQRSVLFSTLWNRLEETDTCSIFNPLK